MGTDQNDVYLQNIPMVKDNFTYTYKDNIITVRFEHNNKVQRAFRRVGFKIPEQTTLDFDEYSSLVFMQIDGQKSIYEIGQILHKQYGKDVEPLYERLVTFIDFLEDQKRWIVFKNKLKK